MATTTTEVKKTTTKVTEKVKKTTEKEQQRQQRQLERERKKALKAQELKKKEEAKTAREAKKAEKEAKRLAKEQEAQDNVKVEALIKKLKVQKKEFAQPVPMTPKEKDVLQKILNNRDTVKDRICVQFYGKTLFKILEHLGDEYLISVDEVYYFYNAKKNAGINFGGVFETWLNTSKKIPWGKLAKL